MIRIHLENGKLALFNEWEFVTVASDLLNNEYLVNDRTIRASDLLTKKEERRGIGYIMLDLEDFRLEDMGDLKPAGMVWKDHSSVETIDVYRVVKVDWIRVKERTT